MKKYVRYFLFFNLIVALINTGIRADMDCMDNSFHLDRSCGPDFKRYHHVQCNCPCTRYAQSFIRGRCEQCRHYRAPQPLEIVRYNKATKCAQPKTECSQSSCKAH